MILLLLGLALFLGAHSVRIVADGWREGIIARRGAGPWKGLYSVCSLAGFVLIVIGYGQARGGSPLLTAGAGLRGVTWLLVWLGFVFVTAAYWPRNHIKRALGDPMVFGVGLWALGHLLVKTTPAGLALFGAFLAWAVVDYLSLRGRARAAAVPAPAASVVATGLTVVVGTLLWAVFAMLLHRLLIGVSPMG